MSDFDDHVEGALQVAKEIFRSQDFDGRVHNDYEGCRQQHFVMFSVVPRMSPYNIDIVLRKVDGEWVPRVRVSAGEQSVEHTAQLARHLQLTNWAALASTSYLNKVCA